MAAEALSAAIPSELSDPNAVHINMLRGAIAKPTVEQIIHIYGADVLKAALASQDAEPTETDTTANADLIARLRAHVRKRDNPAIPNGAWAMMLEAADALELAGDRVERAEADLETAEGLIAILKTDFAIDRAALALARKNALEEAANLADAWARVPPPLTSSIGDAIRALASKETQ